jgi:branched-chain amino acid transport system ATP-binding protein
MLELSNVHVSYGGVSALRGISLSLHDHGTATIVGANGAGKSSTLRTIIGLVRPKSGEVRFLGERIDGLPPAEIVRRGVALCPEGRRVFPFMTVHENLLVGGYLHSDQVETKRLLDLVFGYFPRLAERRKQLAGSLSGGEQQMLAIGRALMARPKLLLLDEPSLGLAPRVTQEIGTIIQRIHEQDKISVLLVEQNVNLALRVSKQAYVLETGSIVLEGKGADLLNEPKVRESYLGI